MEKLSSFDSPDIADRLWDRGIKILTCSLYFVSGFILSGAELLSMKIPLSIGLASACTGYELVFPFSAEFSAQFCG